MIISNRLNEYIELLSGENSPYTEKIRQEALRDGVPIIKRSSEAFLKALLAVRDFRRILEVGTAVGYSTLVMAEAGSARITTIEKFPSRITEAKRNFANSIYRDRIVLLEGEASEHLQALAESGQSFDFILMDAAKAQYIKWLPLIKSLMEEGAVLFSDNILQEGSIIESRFVIERRDRTIHQRLREYLHSLSHDAELRTGILPTGDGVAFSVLRRKHEEENRTFDTCRQLGGIENSR